MFRIYATCRVFQPVPSVRVDCIPDVDYYTIVQAESSPSERITLYTEYSTRNPLSAYKNPYLESFSRKPFFLHLASGIYSCNTTQNIQARARTHTLKIVFLSLKDCIYSIFLTSVLLMLLLKKIYRHDSVNNRPNTEFSILAKELMVSNSK